MATALAKIFQDDHFTEALIICPKNLVKMWEEYVAEYRLLAKVLSVTRVGRDLPDLRRYRVVLIDESHNLRNREGRRFKAIQEYVHENESRCILLSATPYNKTYADLSNQLRLFVPEDRDLGSGLNVSCSRSARPSSSVGIKLPCDRLQRSRRANSRMIGGS
ncbi:MAG: hypothetical protein WDN31_11530 [Hyphomicrobium sp.]